MKKMILILVLMFALLIPAFGFATTSNPAPGSSAFVMPVTFSRTATATVNAVARIKVPFPCSILAVSTSAETIDLTDTDETYTVDVKEAGTTILSSAISIAAADTVYEGTLSDKKIADEAVLTVVLTLGGTTPSLTDLSVLIMVQPR